MATKKTYPRPDNTNTILLSEAVEYFGGFNDQLKQYFEDIEEQDGTVNLMDDYFPFKYNSIQDLLDSIDKLISLQEEIQEEFD